MNDTRACGFTLIETLVGLAVFGAILTVCINLLHHALTYQQRAFAVGDQHRSAERLSAQFRRDVQQAISLEAESTPGNEPWVDRVVIHHDAHDGEETVVYRLASETVERSSTRRDGGRQQEYYVFPRGTRLECQELAAPRRMSLTLWLTLPQPRPLNRLIEPTRASQAVAEVKMNLKTPFAHVVPVVGRDTPSYASQESPR